MDEIVYDIWFVRVYGMETWIRDNSCLEIKIKINLILNKLKNWNNWKSKGAFTLNIELITHLFNIGCAT